MTSPAQPEANKVLIIKLAIFVGVMSQDESLNLGGMKAHLGHEILGVIYSYVPVVVRVEFVEYRANFF